MFRFAIPKINETFTSMCASASTSVKRKGVEKVGIIEFSIKITKLKKSLICILTTWLEPLNNCTSVSSYRHFTGQMRKSKMCYRPVDTTVPWNRLEDPEFSLSSLSKKLNMFAEELFDLSIVCINDFWTAIWIIKSALNSATYCFIMLTSAYCIYVCIYICICNSHRTLKHSSCAVFLFSMNHCALD